MKGHVCCQLVQERLLLGVRTLSLISCMLESGGLKTVSIWSILDCWKTWYEKQRTPKFWWLLLCHHDPCWIGNLGVCTTFSESPWHTQMVMVGYVSNIYIYIYILYVILYITISDFPHDIPMTSQCGFCFLPTPGMISTVLLKNLWRRSTWWWSLGPSVRDGWAVAAKPFLVDCQYVLFLF